MGRDYDVIVVGARCAGSPTAMLLARKGHRVLVVDRAFPSDTISTHLVHRPGVDAPVGGCSTVRSGRTARPSTPTPSTFAPFAITGKPVGPPTRPGGRCSTNCWSRQRLGPAPRFGKASPWRASSSRTVESADSRPREGRRDGGRTSRRHYRGRRPLFTRRRRGRRRGVRHEAEAAGRLLQLLERPAHERPLHDVGLSGNRLRRLAHERRSDPGHRRLAFREFEAKRDDFERHFFETVDLAPDFAERPAPQPGRSASSGRRSPAGIARRTGRAGASSAMRATTRTSSRPRALHDAFLDAELCADALDQVFSRARPFEEAMEEYRSSRDARTKAMYELTADFASLDPPTPELQQLLAAVSRTREASDGFARGPRRRHVVGGVLLRGKRRPRPRRRRPSNASVAQLEEHRASDRAQRRLILSLQVKTPALGGALRAASGRAAR